MLNGTNTGRSHLSHRRIGPIAGGERGRAAGALFATLALAFVLSACGGTSSNSSTTASASANVAKQTSAGGGTVVSGPGGTVRIRSIDDLDTFDPAKTGAPNMAVQAIELTYDRLVYLSPSGKLEPYLATKWTTTPDSVTFTIRKGPTCADGTPMSAQVVANSLKYELAKSTAGPYLGYVVGPGAVKSITTDAANNTVTVTLTKPYNALLTSFSVPFATPVICPAGVKNPKSLSAAPDGSGPYVYDKSQSQRGSTYTFTLRKNYNWGPEGWTAQKAGVPTTVVDRVATDETTGANLFETGEVDIAPVYGINEPRVAANTSAYTFTTQSLQMGSWGTLYNQSAGRVGADPAVRHATYLALDNNAMVKAAFSNLGVVFNTMATPQMQCYNPSVGSVTPGYNVAQAKQILQQDGYKMSGGVMTKNGKPLKIKIVMWNTTNQLGDYIQQQLQKVGISSTVENTDINTWISALFTTKNYDLTVYSYYSAFPNPVIMPAQDASLSINDPTYVKLSQDAMEASGPSQCPAWDKALSRAVTAYDVKPMGVSKNVWFGKGWKFAAPYNVLVDPFTLEKTQ
jgi:peptide/nickel transport system substrate-binding protein